MINENLDKVDAEFGATTGHGHTGVAGDGPKITASGLAGGAGTDSVIGNRTADPATTTAYGLVGTLTQWLSWIAKYFKTITGTANPFDTPAITLADTKIHVNDSTRHITSAERATWNGKLTATSYTASDVLAKLLTVDGTGSGLDAGLVNGMPVDSVSNAPNTIMARNGDGYAALSGLIINRPVPEIMFIESDNSNKTWYQLMDGGVLSFREDNYSTERMQINAGGIQLKGSVTTVGSNVVRSKRAGYKDVLQHMPAANQFILAFSNSVDGVGDDWNWNNAFTFDDIGGFTSDHLTAQKLTLNGGPESLKLKPGTEDHAYMGFYARSANAAQRSGYFGYGGAGSNTMDVSNEIPGGNLQLVTKAGQVVANSSIVVTKGETNAYALKLTSASAGWGSGMYFENTAVGGNTYGVYSGSDGMLHMGLTNQDHILLNPNRSVSFMGPQQRKFSGSQLDSKVYRDLAYMSSTDPALTGTIKITMPRTWTFTMLTMKIKGYNYSGTTGAWELLLGGYTYGDGQMWVNTSATLTGAAPFTTVRFAHDGTHCCILLGGLTTTWGYAKIVVDNFIAHQSYVDDWETGWSVAAITTEAGITVSSAPVINAGTNSDKLDGFHASTSNTANTAAVRDVDGDLHGRRFVAYATTGVAPFVVASTTEVPNLNPQLHGGKTLAEVVQGSLVFAVTTGTAAALAASINPAPAVLSAGLRLSIKTHVATTGPVTLNLNGLGAKSIKKPNGNNPPLALGGVYTLVYDGSAFILQGEGGEYGTAGAAQVLAGYTVGTESGIVPGAVPNRSAENSHMPALQYTTWVGDRVFLAPPAGYYDGSSWVTAPATDIRPENIRLGKSVLGISGTLIEGSRTTSGNSAARTISSTANWLYVDGIPGTSRVITFCSDSNPATVFGYYNSVLGVELIRGYSGALVTSSAFAATPGSFSVIVDNTIMPLGNYRWWVSE
ncbi:hypothetical protein [Paenibacillus sp. P32E]|uniref:hypothetical protein n=1 Tax=Paenibacillus sp. P32E TaxID=1349434 RepID=UPI0015B95504|nr:hypothetical protein [Paenibacillus sp. P32E]